jgi:release factor glutamine methyltransferase
MILEKVILEGSSILKKNGIKTSRLDSEILMSKTINKDRVFIILNSNQNLEKKSLSYFFDLIKKRSKGTPISYLTGKKSFWNNEFQINKNVLIPRPDTELIIQEALKFTKNKNKLRVLDIGTGSGCLILTILKEKKNFSGIGIDISKKCLNLAKINRDNFALANRVKFLKSDIDNFNYGKYDLIISNPPYIRKIDLKYLERDVINFEPLIALNGGIDGLSEIRKVIYRSFKLLKSNGKLILEIGFNQKNDVKKLLKKKGFYINEVVKDLAKNNRCIISTKI